MMHPSVCDEEENILRAVTLFQWDKENSRLSSSLFEGPGTSVGRLSISSFDELVDIFKLKLHKPPDNSLEYAGEINIGTLKKIANRKVDPRSVTVIPKPEVDYEAHAEIVEKLPRAICKEINKNLQLSKINI